MRRLLNHFIAFAALLCLIFCTPAFGFDAHFSSGKTARRHSDKFKSGIAGRITDPNGAVVAGARIKITARSTKTIVSRTSNDEGAYVADLDPDTYDVEAEAPGFKTARRTSIPVLRESRSFVDFVLELN